MKIDIVTTGHTVYKNVDSEVAEGLADAIANNDADCISDWTDVYRSDMETTDEVTIYDDNGKMLWHGEF